MFKKTKDSISQLVKNKNKYLTTNRIFHFLFENNNLKPIFTPKIF